MLPLKTLDLVQRGFRRGARMFWRGRGWGSSLLSMLGVLLFIQLCVIALLGMREFETALNARQTVQLQMQQTVTDRQAQEFLVALRQLPYVSAIEFVTRERMLEQQRMAHPELIGYLDQRIQNPFADSVNLTLACARPTPAHSASPAPA